MSRFFSGFRAGNGGNKKSAAKMFIEKMNNKGADENMSAEDQYKKMFDDRMSSMKNAAYKPGFSLPGTQGGGRQMSKSAEAMLEMLAEKKAKQDMKRMRKKAEQKYAEEKRIKNTLELKKKQEASVVAQKKAESDKAFWGNVTGGSNSSSSSFWGGTDKKDDGWW